MSEYTPPLRDLRFVLNEIVDLEGLSRLEPLSEATSDLVDAVLEEAGRFSREVVAPLNRVGDAEGSRLENGVVVTAPGFKEAYRQYTEGGWQGMAFDPEYGGQGLPYTVATAVEEMIGSACMAFSLCPMLTRGAIELISVHGTADQKEAYLGKLIAGEWSGTMNLTEPQAGSDVGAVRSKAVPEGDHFRIKGTKIFITYGEHDMAENIVHLVLARLPEAPPGTRGISCFIVPKFLVNADGSLGARNDLRCVSLEHKLGIHASPTAVMSFGDNEGAIGYLVGPENGGMRCMFTMMNAARMAVGQEGLSIGERAYQQALSYACERIQGRPLGADEGAAIVEHPDVRRQLMTIKCQLEAARALQLFTAQSVDISRHHPEAERREQNADLVDLLTPVVKGWITDMGVEVTSMALQVHGGMGFIEETGAAQHYRDARIAPIYEGTNGIQALDLIGRKLALKGGQVVRDFLDRVRDLDVELAAAGDDLATLRQGLEAGVEALGQATEWLLACGDARDAAAGATPYLRLFGIVAGGYLMSRAALAARMRLAAGDDEVFHRAKIATARFYGEQILPQAPGLLGPATRGATTLFEIDAEGLSV
ncbi:MAG TPA: acyl-CoA dehydrogenase [Alphaproteobacteria bacterium]|jgi:alkylation response protein AidB-like acyl-CoA dehydrogenase|nr:acyl-CoA dehydrogenase [Alphaproteobacteria bacterium]MDP6269944.1 acyl-CoA dehydrogenase [Alphaproteobacteria bacterium]MDP7163688.1 acyl-CoA dehydrogenase [Alphaproteobacteria bacterium]HJM49939.1 acyl-CoA dehydrogenase [Alphaproteobacteria bacterium]